MKPFMSKYVTLGAEPEYYGLAAGIYIYYFNLALADHPSFKPPKHIIRWKLTC
jgi:hypothetical protein